MRLNGKRTLDGESCASRCDGQGYYLIESSLGHDMEVPSTCVEVRNVEKAVEYVLLGQDHPFSLDD